MEKKPLTISIIGIIDAENKAFLRNFAPNSYFDTFEGMSIIPRILINLENNLSLHLYAQPGQKRFDFIWETLSEKSIGLVLVLNATKAETFRASRNMLESFLSFQKVPYVIALTDFKNPEAFSPDDVRMIFRFSEHVSVLNFDPSQSGNSAQTLAQLFRVIPQEVNQKG